MKTPRPRRGARAGGPAAGSPRAKGAAVGTAPIGAAPLPATHPATIAALVLTAAAILGSVTYHLPDTDTWQHLLVGKAIWQTHTIPTTQLWTWPTYGAPDVNPSWGFRALLWPFYALGGTAGLFAWRWVTTAATFALLGLAAVRMGARGFGVFAALILCAVLARLRVQIRPETLAMVLLAAEIWMLEGRRAGLRDRTGWLLAVALVWANSHVSAFLFFVVLGAYALHDLVARRRPPAEVAASEPAAGGDAPAHAPRDGPAAAATEMAPAPIARRFHLPRVGIAALAVMLVNPWGWRTLAQPFEYFFVWRHEPIFATIGELGRPRWAEEIWNGWAVAAVAIPALLIWRWRRRGPDLVQLTLFAVFGAMAISSMRFLGFFAIGMAPFVARDLSEWLAARRWPAWSATPWARVAGVAAVIAAVAVPSWSVPGAQMGFGDDLSEAPVAASDFIARHGVHGRAFNNFELGGYLLWRFWPERTRLPFMDVHVAGTREDRRAYMNAFVEPGAWHALDARYDFDWALIRHRELPGENLLDRLDRDSTWALVFVDDVAALYVRRRMLAAGGTLAAAAFRELRAGHESLRELGAAAAADSARRAVLREELERAAAESRANSVAHAYLSLVAELDGDLAAAARHQRAALAVDPQLPRGEERLRAIQSGAGGH